MINKPFQPQYGKTKTATTLAGAVNVTVDASPKQLLLENVGTVLAFIRVKPNGDATDASANDMPLPAGRGRVISKDDSQTVVSVFSSGAGSTVYITPGEGRGGQ